MGGLPLPSLKIGAEELVIALVEAEKSNLQVVLLVVGGEAGLASDVGGAAIFGGGDGSSRLALLS